MELLHRLLRHWQAQTKERRGDPSQKVLGGQRCLRGPNSKRRKPHKSSLQGGVGLDFDMYLRHGWYSPARITFALPLAMHTTRPTVHAVVREEGMWHQGREGEGGASRIGCVRTDRV